MNNDQYMFQMLYKSASRCLLLHLNKKFKGIRVSIRRVMCCEKVAFAEAVKGFQEEGNGSFY
jgi:hypothetical protein